MGNSFTKTFDDNNTVREEIINLEKSNESLKETINTNIETSKSQIQNLNDKNNKLTDELSSVKDLTRKLKEDYIQIKYKHDLYKTMNTNLTNIKEELETQLGLLNIKHNNLIKSYSDPKKVDNFLKNHDKKSLDDSFEKEYLLEFQKYFRDNL